MLKRTIAALRRDGGLYPLSALAVILAAIAIGAAYWFLIGPAHLAVGVAPVKSVETDLIEAFSQLLSDSRRGVRLSVRKFEQLQDAAHALEAKEVDLAVVRPDLSLPTNGLTVAILRQEALFILYPTGQKIEKVPDLAGKTLALVTRNGADNAAIGAVLDFYDVSTRVRIERVEEADVGRVLASGRIAAAAFVATPGDAETRRVARAIANGFGKPVKLLEIGQSEAFSASHPGFAAIKIPAGGLLANPVVPAEEASSIGVSWRLMARAGLDRGPISVLTERLFESRSALAKASPVAMTMKAPDSDDATSAVLPNHRGALDYFNREQLTFMDRYGDWLWFGLFAAGGVSSAFAWIGQMFTRRRKEVMDQAFDRLCKILSDARRAESQEDLAALAQEVDRLVSICVRRARRRTTDARMMSALMLVIDAARAAVHERREELAAAPRPDVKEANPPSPSAVKTGFPAKR
ncbi:MAG: C4-dicarboxylate ABC transporter substrate-binding protein [Beijerinckiaceae bacterium]|nr:C4-dicarboxylate ABC transporter substrate-binding protein [Beijerinckiaceae bacterium]